MPCAPIGPLQITASPGCTRSGGDADAFGDDSDAAGIDKEFVAFATFHHLGITGDNLHAGFVGRLPHGLHDALQVGKRQALFEYEPGSEVKRTGTAAGKVVHRPVHRQVADIASGKRKIGSTTKESVEHAIRPS